MLLSAATVQRCDAAMQRVEGDAMPLLSVCLSWLLQRISRPFSAAQKGSAPSASQILNDRTALLRVVACRAPRRYRKPDCS
jgi:hypothetical protein